MQQLSALPTWKVAFTALLVLDTVISAGDTNEKIVKAMDDIQDFVSEIYRQVFEDPLICIFRNNFLTESFDK
jgi:hypothetical protein